MTKLYIAKYSIFVLFQQSLFFQWSAGKMITLYFADQSSIMMVADISCSFSHILDVMYWIEISSGVREDDNALLLLIEVLSRW